MGPEGTALAVRSVPCILFGCFELMVMHKQKLVVRDFRSARVVVGFHLLADDSVDKLVRKPIACVLVELSKGVALVGGQSRMQHYGAGDERELLKSPSEAHAGPHTHKTTTSEMVIRHFDYLPYVLNSVEFSSSSDQLQRAELFVLARSCPRGSGCSLPIGESDCVVVPCRAGA